MKVKEYPPSAWRMARLSLLQLKQVRQGLNRLQCPVIVSMTSIRPRLKYVHHAVRSVLAQSAPPKEIILWLDHSCENAIPKKLEDLRGDRFRIEFREDVGPHTKLIYALREFPEKVIVTCDDDLMYGRDWLSKLYHAHQQHPLDVIGNQCRTVRYQHDGTPLPYRQWADEVPGRSNPNTMPLGYAGVLYPPDTLAEHATDSILFRKLAPKADDLWFKAMSLLAGTLSRRSPTPGVKPYPIPFSQSVSLQKSNVKADANRDQWMAIAEHFGIEPLEA